MTWNELLADKRPEVYGVVTLATLAPERIIDDALRFAGLNWAQRRAMLWTAWVGLKIALPVCSLLRLTLPRRINRRVHIEFASYVLRERNSELLSCTGTQALLAFRELPGESLWEKAASAEGLVI